MKTVFYILFLFTFLYSNTSYDEALKKYDEGKYKESINIMESLVSEGYESGDLYYNLGNSYFRDGRFDLAIYNYEKAKNFIYNDEDLNTNLSIARLQLVDKPEEKVELFFVKYIKNLLHDKDLKTLLFRIVSFSILFAILFSVYFLIKRSKFKSLILFLSLISFIFLIFYSFSFYYHYQFCNRSEGIVVEDFVRAFSSPDKGSNSTELFNLHRGTKVEIERETPEWFEVKVSDEKVGWTRKDNIKSLK
ncbi:MAG: hypothetical protein CR982_09435 [Candidatus Cloacimonadota bacterium]|nr:MAG: hypothetical protein CR982_09435 [Candidatus Cloacimonadota bacterium]PIE79262.1 MAG: hypothetical protein CSA15_03610 [Candidatus Delongbacteria bacterium]